MGTACALRWRITRLLGYVAPMQPSPTYTPYQSKYFAHRLTQESMNGGGVTQSEVVPVFWTGC